MNLPKSFLNVFWKIGNEYAYSGELIFTRGVIYYFPEADLLAERISQSGNMRGPAYAGGIFGAVLGQLLYVAFAPAGAGVKKAKRSRLQEMGVWQKDDSCTELQNKLDARIAQLKADRSINNFATSLPIPLRLTTKDVRYVRTSFLAQLVIEAQYEKHIFNVGIRNKKELREALSQTGF